MKPHLFTWDRRAIGFFWDHFSAVSDATYFSDTAGESILKQCQGVIGSLRGKRLLDFGCGPGFLLEKLASRGVACDGIDFSIESVAAANARLARHATSAKILHVDVLPSPLRAASYDAVFLIETIEHLLDDDRQTLLQEIRRLLKPGGFVVVTTPNSEVLRQSHALCPECGCVFHRVQHLTSWTAAALTGELQRHGFSQQTCRPTFFGRPTWTARAYGVALRLARKKLPHLMYIGQRT